LPTVIDASTHTGDSSPSASYAATGITTTDTDTLLIFCTCAKLADLTVVTVNTGPDSSTGLIFSSEVIPGYPGLSPMVYGRWQQLAGSADASEPYIFRAYCAWWAGSGATGTVAYPSPGGSTASTSFLLAFKE
jgi:hypothetical protein